MRILRLREFSKDEFPLAVLSGSHGDYPLHRHEFQELAIVFAGSCGHTLEGASYRIEAGDVFVIANAESHAYSDSEGLRLANVLFDLPKLGLPLQDLRATPGFLALFELEPRLRAAHKFESRLRLNPVELLEVEELAGRMKKELAARKQGYRALCSGLLLELIATLSRMRPSEATPERRELWNLGKALRLLETRGAESHSLESLAKTAGMSKRNFQRLFKEAVGDSPIKHLLNSRLRKAAEELLASPDLSVGEIALKTGFCDGNYFARQFAARYGKSPTAYRKEAKGQA